MVGEYCSLNGVLVPAEKATIPVDDVNFAYGYGVYETLKVRKRVLYFPEIHEERLFHSAQIIGLAHGIAPGDIARWTTELVRANRTENVNIKIILIGGESSSSYRLYIMALNPLYPERGDYKKGATAVLYDGERLFPEAKSLNMLMSTLAFRKARAAGAYDALLKDRQGFLREGTRTNLFFTDGETIFTPPKETVLEGVTKLTLAETLRGDGIALEEKPLPVTALEKYAGYFLTSTSTKVMPLGRIEDREFGVPKIVRRVMKLYDDFLADYAAGREALF